MAARQIWMGATGWNTYRRGDDTRCAKNKDVMNRDGIFRQNKTDWTYQRVRRYALACLCDRLTENAVLSVTLRIVLCAAPLLSPTMDRSRQVLRPSGESMPNWRDSIFGHYHKCG